MLDFEEKALCRKVAGVLELSTKRGYDSFYFTKIWLKSKTADNLYHWDFNDVAQSKQYLLHSVELEYNLTPSEEDKDEPYLADVMYWVGYILMYMSLELKISPLDIMEKYDVERIIGSYDTLHTVSSTVAVDKIKEDFAI